MAVKLHIALFFLFSLAGCLPCSAQADQYVVDRIQEENGFPYGRISEIMEDHQGYLWFASALGLLRYDGYGFNVFRHEIGDTTSLSHSFARSIYQDRRQTIWVGTTYGLNRFDPVSQTFDTFVPSPVAGQRSKFRNAVWCIFEDASGTFWIGTNMGLFRFDRTTEQFSEVLSGNGEAIGQSVRKIIELPNGDIWAGCYRGLAHVPKGDQTYDRYWVNPDHPEDDVNIIPSDMALAANGDLILSTGAGIVYWNPKTRAVTLRDPQQKSQRATQYLVDKEGNQWIAYWGKGIWLQPEKGPGQWFSHDPQLGQTLSSNSTYDLKQDRFGNIWVGTTNGISRVRRPQKGFALHQNTAQQKDKRNQVSRVLVTQAGDTWMRSEQGIIRLQAGDSASQQIHFFPKTQAEPFLDAFIELPDGRTLWAFRGQGFHQLQPGSTRLQKLDFGDTLNRRQIYKMEIDLDHPDQLWIGLIDGLCHLNLSTGERRWFCPKAQIPSLPNNKLGINTQGIDGKIWLYYTYNSSIGSLDKNTGKFEIFFPPTDKAAYLDGSVYDIQMGSDTAVWLATLYGLVRFDCLKHEFHILTKKDGLPENELYIVQEDQQGRLWIGGYSTVTRYDYRTGELLPFNLRAQIGRFYSKSKCLSADGNLRFGGRYGVYRIDPSAITKDSRPPDLVLSDFKVWNASYPLDQPLDQIDRILLDHDENDISFEFAALHFVQPESNVYQYQLEGYDKDWLDHGSDRKVNYTNLGPGNYIFRVRAANSDGIWTNQELSIPVIINPAVWQTGWFKALLLLVACSIAFAVFRNWQQQQALKREKALAEQAAEYKTRFLANVSHEIRTPMNAIIGLSDLIQETPLQSNQQQFLQTIRRSSANLLKIINDLLDFSKLEAGKFTFTEQAFDLCVVLSDVQEVLQLKAQEKGLDFQVQLGENVPTFLMGDALRLNQILLNLLGNGIKFTEKGSVHLGVHYLGQRIGKEHLQFSVKDTGIGIPQGKLKEIFDDFSQADSNTAAEYGGTGLGLSITRQLIEKQNGQLSIQSEVGQGTTFLIELPFGRSTGVDTPKPEAGPQRTFKPLRILVVEDNAFNQLLAKEFLNMHLPDSSVSIAENGQDAVAQVKQTAFDLILMDIKMPIMNGYEASKAIRALEQPKKSMIPIIGLTAHIVPEQLEKCQEAGMNDCISKPFDKATLLDRIYKHTLLIHEH
ncbi:MAG: ATP-binding protein [Bacteroidota bacterium]